MIQFPSLLPGLTPGVAVEPGQPAAPSGGGFAAALARFVGTLLPGESPGAEAAMADRQGVAASGSVLPVAALPATAVAPVHATGEAPASAPVRLPGAAQERSLPFSARVARSLEAQPLPVLAVIGDAGPAGETVPPNPVDAPATPQPPALLSAAAQERSLPFAERVVRSLEARPLPVLAVIGAAAPAGEAMPPNSADAPPAPQPAAALPVPGTIRPAANPPEAPADAQPPAVLPAMADTIVQGAPDLATPLPGSTFFAAPEPAPLPERRAALHPVARIAAPGRPAVAVDSTLSVPAETLPVPEPVTTAASTPIAVPVLAAERAMDAAGRRTVGDAAPRTAEAVALPPEERREPITGGESAPQSDATPVLATSVTLPALPTPAPPQDAGRVVAVAFPNDPIVAAPAPVAERTPAVVVSPLPAGPQPTPAARTQPAATPTAATTITTSRADPASDAPAASPPGAVPVAAPIAEASQVLRTGSVQPQPVDASAPQVSRIAAMAVAPLSPAPTPMREAAAPVAPAPAIRVAPREPVPAAPAEAAALPARIAALAPEPIVAVEAALPDTFVIERSGRVTPPAAIVPPTAPPVGLTPTPSTRAPATDAPVVGAAPLPAQAGAPHFLSPAAGIATLPGVEQVPVTRIAEPPAGATLAPTAASVLPSASPAVASPSAQAVPVDRPVETASVAAPQSPAVQPGAPTAVALSLALPTLPNFADYRFAAIAAQWRAFGHDGDRPPLLALDGVSLLAADPLAVPGTIAPRGVVAPTAMPVIDMRDLAWPAAMIDRIEALRDMADANDTRIKLAPDALGEVEVRVRREGDTVHVRFTAEAPATRTMIADAQPRLAEIAEARGLKLGSTGVDAGTGQQTGTDHRQTQRDARPQAAARPNPPSPQAEATDADAWIA